MESTPTSKEPPKLGPYLNAPKYSDVTLKVGPHTFHAHRLVMCSWSDVFKKVLLTTACSSLDRNPSDASKGSLEQKNNSTFRFDEEHDCCDVFHHLLEFMYTEALTISDENAVPLLKLCIKYGIEELKLLCDKYISQSVRDLKSWIGTILPLAVSSNLERTKMACLSFLGKHFEQISAQHLQSLDGTSVTALLGCKCPSIVVEDEFVVFQKLTPWLMHCMDDDDFMRVIDCIQFPFMSALQLMKIGSTDVIKRVLKSNPRFLVRTYEQHALFREESTAEFSISTPQPRLYLRPPFESTSRSDHTRDVEPDKEGFHEIQTNREISIGNVLQEVQISTRIETHYAYEHRSWYATAHISPVFDEDYFLGENNLRTRSELEINIFKRNTASSKGRTDHDSMEETEQIAEVAVQILTEAGTTELFVSKKPLPPRNPKDKRTGSFGYGYGSSGTKLFTFKMYFEATNRNMPRKVKARIALVVHNGSAGYLIGEAEECN